MGQGEFRIAGQRIFDIVRKENKFVVVVKPKKQPPIDVPIEDVAQAFEKASGGKLKIIYT